MQIHGRRRGRPGWRAAIVLAGTLVLGAVGAGVGVGADSAQAAVPAPPTKYRAYVFSYNMCGGNRGTAACPEAPGDGVVEEIRDRVKTYEPVAFALQEACNWQVVKLVAVLNADPTLKAKGLTYTYEYANAGTGVPVPPQCYGRWVREAGTVAPAGWGNAVVHLGPKGTEASRTSYARAYSAQEWVVPGVLPKTQRRNFVCSLVQPYNLWVCSTHLGLDAGVRAKQISELATFTTTRLPQHTPAYPMMIGGDFNGEPREMGALLNAGYGGKGHFSEAAVPSGCLLFGSTCAIDPANATEGTKKIDYLFASPEVIVTDTYTLAAKSDHRLLVNRIGFN